MQSIDAYKQDEAISLEQFVVQHAALVKKIATYMKRRLPSSIELDDLIQSGLVGLLDAKKNYDASKGASFETYASIRIRGAMIDNLRKESWMTRDAMKTMKTVAAAIHKVEQREQREATAEDIIAELKISSEEYFKITQELNVFHVMNLDDMSKNDDVLSVDKDTPDKILHRDEMKKILKEILPKLPEKEQLVLSLYYVEEITFKEIGEVLELTEARICQLHSQAILRIRSRMEALRLMEE